MSNISTIITKYEDISTRHTTSWPDNICPAFLMYKKTLMYAPAFASGFALHRLKAILSLFCPSMVFDTAHSLKLLKI
jgi:hypothetical protein